jgi:predicted transcriptional regulator
MTKKVEESKKFLPDEIRMMYLEQLEVRGITDAEEWSDEDVSKKLNELIKDDHKKIVSLSANQLTKDMNKYVEANKEMIIKDRKFIERLFNLNIPYLYLHLYRDADIELNDDQLWDKARKSGINPIASIQKVLAPRYLSTGQKF